MRTLTASRLTAAVNSDRATGAATTLRGPEGTWVSPGQVVAAGRATGRAGVRVIA
jgi:hypothetical protein